MLQNPLCVSAAHCSRYPFPGAIVGRSTRLFQSVLWTFSCVLTWECSTLELVSHSCAPRFQELLLTPVIRVSAFFGISGLLSAALESPLFYFSDSNCETLETPNFLGLPWLVQGSFALVSPLQNLHQNSAPLLSSTWVSDSWRNLKKIFEMAAGERGHIHDVQQTKQVVPFVFWETTFG